jgi:hypothetical protein
MPDPSELSIPGICRGCGCTNDDPCPNGCYWVDEFRTVCSNCASEQEEDDVMAAVAGW